MNLTVGNHFIKKFTAIALSLLLSQPTFAQSSENQQMVFEGTLTDAAGNSINLSNQALTFYVSANGCYLYNEWSSAAGDSQGNISHRIGNGTIAAGSPNSFSQNLFFGSANGKSIATDSPCSVTAADTRLVQVFYPGESITATIKLGTVPYAQNATMLSGKAVTDFVQVSADTNTVFSGGTAGQYLTKSASGLTWSSNTLTAAQISSALGYTPASTTVTLSASSITNALGYTPANNSALSNYAVRSNNLSDLTSATTARTNLGLGTLATKNSVDISTAEVTGTLPTTKLPSMGGDISNATGSGNVTVIRLRNVAVASATPSSGQVLAYDGSSWTPTSVPSGVGTVTNVNAGTGLLGGPITSSGTLSVNFGTSAGTVAQGNDSRLVGALQGVNNLSEITSATIARGNLGLGSLATRASVNLATSDVTGVLPAANGGSKWSQGAGGIYSVSNTTIGSSTTFANTALYVASPLSVSSTVAASINNPNPNGYGLKINTENASSSYYGLRVSAFDSTNFVVLNNGNVGIGLANPTARLHIAGGSSALPGLKLTSGALTTTPSPGAIEFDGSAYYVTDGSAIRRTIATGSSTNSIDNVSTINSTSNITLVTPNSVVVSSTLQSTNSQNGALIVKGGIGVNGNGNFSGTLNATGNISTSGSITTPGNVFAGAVTTPYLYGSTASAGILAIDSTSDANKGKIIIAANGGYVGIGTVSPSYRFHVRSQGPNTYNSVISASSGTAMFGNGEDDYNQLYHIAYNASGQPSWFFTTGGTNYFINNVSLGNPIEIPNNKLSVHGNAYITGNATVSKTLMVNGSNSSPAIQFLTTALTATAVSNTIEYDGASLYYTNSSAIRRRLAGGVSLNTIDNVSKMTYAGNLMLEGNTAATTPAVTINNAGAGTVALQVNNSATVSGSIKLSGDGADSNVTCSTSDEGKQRYNKTLKTMEFCDGAYWQGVTGLTHCTAPTSGGGVGIQYTLVGRPGSPSAFCISKNNESATSQWNAVQTCQGRNTISGFRTRLCTVNELNETCGEYNRLGGSPNAENFLPSFRDTELWVPEANADGYGTTYRFITGGGSQCGVAAIVNATYDRLTGSKSYRCCYQ